MKLKNHRVPRLMFALFPHKCIDCRTNHNWFWLEFGEHYDDDYANTFYRCNKCRKTKLPWEKKMVDYNTKKATNHMLKFKEYWCQKGEDGHWPCRGCDFNNYSECRINKFLIEHGDEDMARKIHEAEKFD